MMLPTKGGLVDQLSCLFDKILKALLNQVHTTFKFFNSPNLLILHSVLLRDWFLTSLDNPWSTHWDDQWILGSISGAIGQVISLTNEVLDFVVSILQNS